MADNAIVPVKPPGVLRRAMQAVAYTITGIDPQTWMSPLNPLRPMAEQSKGRAFDYPVAFNLNYMPRASEPLSFIKLKQLSEVGIIRTLIQTRQDQMSSQEFIIRVKQDEPGVKGELAAKNAAKNKYASKIAEIKEFLESPDRRLDWHQWLHQLLEQHYVYDGCVVYKRRTKAGAPYAWEVVDAATISIKIDADGRPHPPPPSPAYQQVLKGLPASNYTASVEEGPQFTTGEMLYVASNTRVDRAYGFPVVAQIQTHVEMMLARAREQLAEFNFGNSPHGIIEAPTGMNTDQIVSLQDLWDATFAGNPEMRRRMWWVANGSKYTNVPREMLFDQFDEWLVRVACFAFSIAPSPFIKQMNRATADSAQEVATSEGLAPSLHFVARYINRLLDEFGVPQLEFAWADNAELDPSKKAVMDIGYGKLGAITIDEIRDSLGKEGFGGACAEPMYATATGWVPVDPVEAQALKPVPVAPGAAPGGKPAVPGKPGGKPGAPAPGAKKPKPAATTTAAPAKKMAKLAASIYIHRPLLNAFELIEWAKSQGFAGTLTPDDMHVTQCYSRDHVEWAELPAAPSHMVYAEGGPRSVEPLGDEGAVVLKFSNDDLQARFHELLSAGVSHDYEAYQAHVTIAYNGTITGNVPEITKDAEGKETVGTRPRTLADVQPYNGALLFGEEVWRTVKDDWRSIIGKLTGDDLDAAAAQAELNPTQAQIEAGNYGKGHVVIQGLKISIENPRGSTRSGVSDGKPWSVKMPAHYGYINRTNGADGEHVDVYLGPNPDSTTVWVLNQVDATSGAWDEHKVFIGYDRLADAQYDYVNAFSDGKGALRMGSIVALSMDEFKAWLANGDTTQPLTRKRATISQIRSEEGLTFYQISGDEEGGDPAATTPIDVHGLTPDNHEDALSTPVPIRPVLDPLLPREVGKFANTPFGRTGTATKFSEDEARDERGRWASGGGAGKTELKQVKGPAFSGKQETLSSAPSKLATGALGEKVATSFLRDHGLKDAAALNLKTNNFPVDLVGDHQLYEVKTGLVSNGTTAQQWRATIGQPGKAETAWLAKAGPEAKAAWNAQKAQAIIDRKTAAVRAFSKQLGTKVTGRTIGVILNTDKKTADIHIMVGFHSRVGWNSALAKASYVGTYKYK